MTDALRDDEAGALQIGPTDSGMVRFIITTRDGVFELDFEPDEAEDIADELTAAADRARRAQDARGKDARGKDARGKDARGEDARGKDARGKGARGAGDRGR